MLCPHVGTAVLTKVKCVKVQWEYHYSAVLRKRKMTALKRGPEPSRLNAVAWTRPNTTVQSRAPEWDAHDFVFWFGRIQCYMMYARAHS